MYKNILIATDGSEIADKALDHAITLAALHKALLTIITVTNVWSPDAAAAESLQSALVNTTNDFKDYASGVANRIFNDAKDKAARQAVTCKTIQVTGEPPAQAIVQAANDANCDLIVMGTHGRRGMRRMLLGSQACEVLATSDIPVLIHK